MKLKNLETGQVLDRTFRADENVDQAIIERRDHQYLYRDDLGFHFMNLEDFGQLALSGDDVGAAAGYLVEGTTPVSPSIEGHLSLWRCRPPWSSKSPTPSPGQRRHQDRRHQAGHATDRDSDPGPPVRRAGGSSRSRHSFR